MVQDPNSFFKCVWRFNALVIALGGLIGLAGISLAVISIMIEKNKRTIPLTNNTHQLSMSRSNTIRGTDYIYMGIFEDGGSYSGDKVLNYLFIDTKNNKHKFLLENFKNKFKSLVMIYDKAREDFEEPLYDGTMRNSKNEKVVSIIYKLSQDDGKEKIASSHVDGTNYQCLIEGIDKIYAIQQAGDETVLFLYEKNKEMISDIYSVPNMKKISTNVGSLRFPKKLN